MTSAAPMIVRVPRAREWRALDGDQEVGRADAVPRPDRRWFVPLDSWRADSCEGLLAAITRDIQQDLYITMDESEDDQLHRCGGLGFTVNRREDEHLVPTDHGLPVWQMRVFPRDFISCPLLMRMWLRCGLWTNCFARMCPVRTAG